MKLLIVFPEDPELLTAHRLRPAIKAMSQDKTWIILQQHTNDIQLHILMCRQYDPHGISISVFWGHMAKIGNPQPRKRSNHGQSSHLAQGIGWHEVSLRCPSPLNSPLC